MNEAPLEYRLWMIVLDSALFFLTNLLWFGVALYGWVLWRRARQHIAALPVPQPMATRDAIVRAALIRFGRVLGLCIVLFLVYDFARDVRMRRSAHDCKRSLTTPAAGAAYLGETCSVDGGRDINAWGEGTRYWGLLRVYDAQSGELLAREFVPEPESDIHWEQDAVWQQGGDANGTSGATIQLPPTTWDRFKATLP